MTRAFILAAVIAGGSMVLGCQSSTPDVPQAYYHPSHSAGGLAAGAGDSLGQRAFTHTQLASQIRMGEMAEPRTAQIDTRE